jgi:hypothetical protein
VHPIRWWLLSVVAAMTFGLSNQHLKLFDRQMVRAELQVALPVFVQVAMAAGDRYLAADIAAIRALWADNFKMRPDEFKVLAKLQEDVSWLNPAHEDNYYIAAAVLPWNGEFDAAQRVLRRATIARRFDYQPAFFYGFNLLHFKGDAKTASQWLVDSAQHLPEGDNRLQMQNLAAIWVDRASDPDLAIRVVEAMSKQANRADFRRYLESRVVRLKMLRELRNAAAEYEKAYGRRAASLNDLVATKLLPSLPRDPFGFGFAMDRNGNVVLRTSPPTANDGTR